MKMISIQELAIKHKVSYQAIYKHFRALKKEEAYREAYKKQGSTTLLNAELVEAIEARMNIREEVSVSDAVNEELEAENKQLTEVNAYQKTIIRLQAEKEALLLQVGNVLALEATNADLQQRLQDSEARAHNAEVEAEVQRAAADEAQRRTSEAIARAERAEKDLSETSDKNIALQTERDLEKKRREEAEAELDNLKSRGFWSRLFNRT